MGRLINNSGQFVRTAADLVMRNGVGVYPNGFRMGRIAFGMDRSVLAPRRPLVAVDGSPRTVIKAREPHTYRGQIEGMSLVSRDRGRAGLFPEILSLEKTLNKSAGDIFEFTGTDRSKIRDSRSGFDARMARYGRISIRDIVRNAGRVNSVPAGEGVSDLAHDLAHAAGLVENSKAIAPEVAFVAGVLYVAFGDGMKDYAIRTLVTSSESMFVMKRSAASAMLGEIAIYEAGSFKLNGGNGLSIGEHVARSWVQFAMDSRHDGASSLISHLRGLIAALASGAWEQAGHLYRSETDLVSDRVERGKGYARAGWAFGNWAHSDGHVGWEQAGAMMGKAADEWDGAPDFIEERETALALEEAAKTLNGD